MRRSVTVCRATIDRAAPNCHLKAMMSLRIANRPAAAVWFRVVLLAAIVLAAFAHRPAVSAPTRLELAQYVLPDGTWPDLCATEDGAPSPHQHELCDFCLIAGSSAAAQPVAASLSQPLPLLLAVVMPPMTAPPVVAVDLATASKRGPPSVSV
jgi:hypothetical protein